MKYQQEVKIKDGGFLQSKYWQEFQEKIGNKVIVKKIGKGGFLAIKSRLPLGLKYLFVPRGPILQAIEKKDNKKIIEELVTEGVRGDVAWIKIEPQTNDDLQAIENFIGEINKVSGTKYKVNKSLKEHQPKQTLMVDLKLDEGDIMGGFKSKTRYNTRLAGRKGVEVREAKDIKDIERFLDLMEETAERDKIKNHPREHYRKMILDLPSEAVRLYLAEHEGNILAGAIVTYAGEVATYLHGASSNRKRNLMAPFGLQWEIMRQAKNSGYKKYDLGGTKVEQSSDGNNIAEDGHWQGISRFKIGFCPRCQPVEFPGGYDIVLNRWKYLMYRFLQKVR